MTDYLQPDPAARRRAWRAVWALTLAVLALRVVALVVSPLELAGDEAHYWEWSQRPALSYYSKGPGIAWAIGASTAPLGDAEWAVRLTAPVSGAASMLALAALAGRLSRAPRAPLYGAAGFCLLPVYLVTSMLVTIDAPFLASWSVSLLLAHVVTERLARGAPAAIPALALGAAIGVGFLFKYTILLLVPGLVASLWLAAPGARSAARWGALGATLLACAIVAAPVAIWNAEHGWPTVRHLLGHLDLAAGDYPEDDVPAPVPWYSPLMFVGAQIALAGPMIALMARVALRRPWDPGARLMLLAAAPVWLGYLAVSFFIEAEANWPIAAYLSLIPLVARDAARELPRYHAMVEAWLALPERPRPRRGVLRRKPETAFQVGWHWSIGLAVVVALAFPALPLLERVPVLERVVPTHRLQGGRAMASAVAEALDSPALAAQPLTPILCKRYTTASLLAYYLERERPDAAGRAAITSIASRIGDRPSSYDYFPDTDPTDESWVGASVLLVGGGRERWEGAFRLGSFRTLDEELSIHLATDYGGPIEP
jgi:4-amino-4-deoxy-L-arabinose transferase-like glycosyltransferase